VACEDNIGQFVLHPYVKLCTYTYDLRSYTTYNPKVSQEYFTLHNKIVLPLLSVVLTGIVKGLPPVGLENVMGDSPPHSVISGVAENVANHLYLISKEISAVFPVPEGKVQPDISAVVCLLRELHDYTNKDSIPNSGKWCPHSNDCITDKRT